MLSLQIDKSTVTSWTESPSPGNLKRGTLHSGSQRLLVFSQQSLSGNLLIAPHNCADIEGRIGTVWGCLMIHATKLHNSNRRSRPGLCCYLTWKTIHWMLGTLPNKLPMQPLHLSGLAWLATWFVLSWGLVLNWKGLTSFNYKEIPATVPATCLHKNIALSAQLSSWMSPQSCRQNPYYWMTCCKVPEISVVLIRSMGSVAVPQSCPATAVTLAMNLMSLLAKWLHDFHAPNRAS